MMAGAATPPSEDARPHARLSHEGGEGTGRGIGRGNGPGDATYLAWGSLLRKRLK